MITINEVERPKTYQVPKVDHPWRQYANRKVAKQERTDIIHIKQFLSALIAHWDEYEIITVNAFEGNNKHKLRSLPQRKVALWLMATIKRNYVDQL